MYAEFVTEVGAYYRRSDIDNTTYIKELLLAYITPGYLLHVLQ